MADPIIPMVSQNTPFNQAFSPFSSMNTLTPASFNFGGSPIATTPVNLTQQLNGLTSTGAPGVNLPGGMGGGLGWNMDTAKLALSGLQTIGGLWGAFQANKLAKQQFRFQRDFAETNLANQIQSYNTALADRARSRGAMEGQSQAQTQAYIDQNQLSRRS